AEGRRSLRPPFPWPVAARPTPDDDAMRISLVLWMAREEGENGPLRQSAIRDLLGLKHDRAGNLPPLPSIFHDQPAPGWLHPGTRRKIFARRFSGRPSATDRRP